MNKQWRGKDDRVISPGDVAKTISGKRRIVQAIDKDGYAELFGEISTFYVPHMTKPLHAGE